MDRRLFLVMGLSLIFALVVSSVFYVQIAGRTRNPKPAVNLKEVVVATKPLDVGMTIKAEDVKLAKVMADLFPTGAYNKIEDVLDRPVVNKILMDEPVLEPRLAVKGSGLGLAPIIPVGMRAVSVRVTDVAGVAGFVLPGLRVDVLVTGQLQGSEDTVTTTCLQNILVLSAGQVIQPDARGQAINTPTVTLLVSPEQAETLTLAGNEGRIQLVLRNSSDRSMEKTPGTNTGLLFSGRTRAPRSDPDNPSKATRSAAFRPKPSAVAAPSASTIAQAPPPEVIVIRGNQRSVEIVSGKAN